jgi:hypothetical protein
MSESNTTIITPVGILSYPNLFTTQKNDKYSAVLVFQREEDLAPIRAALRAAGEKFFGDKLPALLKSSSFKVVLKGKELAQEKYGGQITGAVGFVNMYATRKPQVVGPDLAPIEESRVYPGCRARAYVNAYAWANDNGKGLSLGLNAIQIVGDGPRLDNRKDASEVFDAVLAETAAADLDIGL